MLRKSPFMLWAMLLSAVVLVSTAALNRAQETEPASSDPPPPASTVETPPAPPATPPAAPPTVAPPVIEDAADEEASEDDEPKALLERTIYIPYEDLRKTFEKEGRGVFLPYEEFRTLWDKAREAEKPQDPEKPPVESLITETINAATVAKDVVEVEATVRIELLTKGWHEVPLRLSNAAIEKATIDGQPARVVKAPSGAGYQLLIEKKKDGAEQIELQLKYAKAIQRSPGHNSVSFESPMAPVSRWKVTIPESGVKVDFYPLIAATEMEKEADAETSAEPAEEASPDETVVLAFVGAAPTVRIGWTPKAEGATGLEALATVQAEQQVTVEEGVVRTQTRLNYTISRAELDKLAIEVPGEQRVVNVFDANIRGWTVNQGDDTQTLDIQLFEPAKNAQTIVVELEKFHDQAEDEQELTKPINVVIPTVKALGVGRQQGVVVVRVVESLSAEAVKSAGLLQIDKGELPANVAGGDWQFAYRYATVPFGLTLSVEKVQPRITVDSLVEARLTPERLYVDVTAAYMIERAGVFQLEWDIPEGYTVRSVGGRSFNPLSGRGGNYGGQDINQANVAGVSVETHHLEPIEGETSKRLIVNLSRKAIGRVGLILHLERKLDEPDLLTPTGVTVPIPCEIPRVAEDSVEHATGRLAVYAPESLRVNPKTADGLRTVSYAEAVAGIQTYVNQPGVLAYMFGEEPAELTLDVERRKPHITIEQLLVADIEDGVVKYTDTLFYNIRYSGVKELRVDVPADVAATIRNDSDSIRESVIEPQPDDVPEGYVAWRFAGENELENQGRIDLSWEKKLEQLSVGGTVELELPELIPMGADLASGQIVLKKAETIDLHETGESEGLRPIDPQHDLMDKADVSDGAAAYEFHGPWSITITATRYEMAEIKHTSIELAVLRAVVTKASDERAGTIKTQALYSIRSARQRLQMALPAGVEITVSQLNGRSIDLETETVDGRTLYYLPLVGTEPDKPFLFELQYSTPAAGDGKTSASGIMLEYPDFPLEPAMQEVYYGVYLPEEWDLVGHDRHWTERFTWEYDHREGLYYPINDPSIDQLVNDVSQGQTPATFPTDGVSYVFSALQPGPSADDALKIATMRRTVLDAIVLILAVAAGLLLLPMRWTYRVYGVAAIVIVGLLIALFNPTLTHHVGDRTLRLAVGIVLVLWAVKLFAWTLPRKCTGIFSKTSCVIPPRPAAASPTQTPFGPPDDQAAPDTASEQASSSQQGDDALDENDESLFDQEPLKYESPEILPKDEDASTESGKEDDNQDAEGESHV